MIDPNDPSPCPLLSYQQADEPQNWSMVGVARWTGWCSLALSVLFFIDPYLPNLHPLMLIPICSAAAGLCLGVLAGKRADQRRAAMIAMVPGVMALVIPAMSMFMRFAFPYRVM